MPPVRRPGLHGAIRALQLLQDRPGAGHEPLDHSQSEPCNCFRFSTRFPPLIWTFFYFLFITELKILRIFCSRRTDHSKCSFFGLFGLAARILVWTTSGWMGCLRVDGWLGFPVSGPSPSRPKTVPQNVVKAGILGGWVRFHGGGGGRFAALWYLWHTIT